MKEGASSRGGPRRSSVVLPPASLSLRAGISKSIHLGAAGGRHRVRLGRIRVPARKALAKHHNALKYLHFYSKTRAKNYHPVDRSWPAGGEFETPALQGPFLKIPTAIVR